MGVNNKKYIYKRIRKFLFVICRKRKTASNYVKEENFQPWNISFPSSQEFEFFKRYSISGDHNW